MFRKMRLEANRTTDKEAEKMLEEATNGVLGVNGDNGYPYAVPLSFAYKDGRIYFHGTVESSHKIESIKKDPRVSFCVIAQDNIIPEAFNTLYRSAIAFGKARILTDVKDIEQGIMAIAAKYSANHKEGAIAYKDAEDGNFCVVEITVEHLTGKFGN